MDPAPGRPGGAPLALATALLYTAGMAALWMVSGYHFDAPTAADQAALALGLVPLVAVVAWLARRAGLPGPLPPPPPRWVRAFGLLGAASLLVPLPGLALALARSPRPSADYGVHLGLSVAACLLVGVGEELAYRGLALNALRQRFSAPIAVAGSSVLFGLLHLSNLLAGRAPESVLVQVGLTTALGSTLAWTYLFSGRRLARVMVLHGLYDLGFDGAHATAYGENPLALVNAGVILATALALAFAGVCWSRKEARMRKPGTGSDHPCP